jgi:hypothetical protein
MSSWHGEQELLHVHISYKLLELLRLARPKDVAVVRLMSLTLSNPIFLPAAYSPALICFGRERGWWITFNYLPVLKEKT